MKKESLYPTEYGCFICGDPVTVCHHIYPGYGRRDVSDKEGCTIRLCPYHHNGSKDSVHFDKDFDSWLRKDCQKRWEAREGISDPLHEKFILLFGRNYL